jgi:hypothetical protein
MLGPADERMPGGATGRNPGRTRATSVEGFLAALSPESRELVLALRDVVRRTAPHAEESLLICTQA